MVHAHPGAPKLADFVDEIRAASPGAFLDPTLGGKLVLATSGSLTISYAPFEAINPSARVVLVGITPGRRQATEALVEAHRQLTAGARPEEAARVAKASASFAGTMRSNIASMLDHIGLHDKLGLSTTAELFGEQSELVHYTSALRYPVFVENADYSGATPKMTAHPLLREQILSTLAEEACVLTDALWIPLGTKVEAALGLLVNGGLLPRDRLLTGLPHASGANAERIAYFLGRKPKSMLSVKTDADRIDNGRAAAMAVVSALPTFA